MKKSRNSRYLVTTRISIGHFALRVVTG